MDSGQGGRGAGVVADGEVRLIGCPIIQTIGRMDGGDRRHGHGHARMTAVRNQTRGRGIGRRFQKGRTRFHALSIGAWERLGRR